MTTADNPTVSHPAPKTVEPARGRASRRRALAWCLPAVLAVAGCVSAAAWLPDGSGFYYVRTADDPGKQAALVHYDLKSAKSVVVAELPVGSASWPAMSPDATQVAVATLDGERQGHLQRLDRKTGKLTSAKVSGWRPEKEVVIPPVLSWSPDGGSVLISTWTEPEPRPADRTLLVDVKSGTTMVLAGGSLALWGGVAPKDRGFLLLTGDKELSLFGWDGRKVWSAAVPDDTASDVGSGLPPTLFQPMIRFRWNGNGAVAEMPGGELTVAAADGKQTFKKVEVVKRGERTVLARVPVGGKGAAVTLIDNADDKKSARLEVGGRLLELPATKPDKPVEPLAAVAHAVSIAPSPDGRRLVVRYAAAKADGKPEQVLVIVDEDGGVTEVDRGPLLPGK